MSFDFETQHESLLLRFEEARKDNRPAEIEEFLDQESIESHPELLAEMVIIDFEIRYRASEPTSNQVYFEKYPQLTREDLRSVILKEEFELRRKWGDLPGEMEARERFADDPKARKILDEIASTPSSEKSAVALFQSGTVVDSYKIENCIGKGAFAIVYSAKESNLQRRVAIKFLSQSDSNEDLHSRMLREARAQALLSHPNIVAVYDVGEHKGFDYIASRLVQGTTLEKQFQNPESVEKTSSIQQKDFAKAAKMAAQLASALHHAHAFGVIHRDIKPANIMVENGVPLLLDFGLARIADSSHQLTHEGDVVGTPAFMPPEQADGRAFQADPRSDVYGLGAVPLLDDLRQVSF